MLIQSHNDLLEIQTPEQVHLGYEVAGLASRCIAAFLDTIIQFLLLITFLFLLALLASQIEFPFSETAIIVLYSITFFCLYWGYFVLFELLWSGQTPGKRLMGIRVLQVTGLPVTLVNSGLRNLVRPIDTFLLGFGAIGIVSIFSSARSQRLGDFAAGTLVVHDRKIELSSLKNIGALQSLPEIIEADKDLEFPVYRLRPTDIHIAESYVARRSDLDAVIGLARPIMEHLYRQMDMEFQSEPIPYNEAVSKMAVIIQSYYAYKNR